MNIVKKSCTAYNACRTFYVQIVKLLAVFERIHVDELAAAEAGFFGFRVYVEERAPYQRECVYHVSVRDEVKNSSAAPKVSWSAMGMRSLMVSRPYSSARAWGTPMA